ncbi:MAG: PLDc N-terminal domain-containing protein [archaeon]
MAIEIFFFGILLIALILNLALFLATIAEILQAKNDGTWKILWALVCFVLGIFGIILYLLIGRKDLQGNKIGFIKWLLIGSLLFIALLMVFFVLTFVISSGTAVRTY